MIADHEDDKKEKINSRVLQHVSQLDVPRNGNYGGSGGGPTS